MLYRKNASISTVREDTATNNSIHRQALQGGGAPIYRLTPLVVNRLLIKIAFLKLAPIPLLK